MTTIKDGYDSEPLELSFRDNGHGAIELWIKNKSLKETLSYVTLNELIELRDEINQVIKEVVGLD